MRSIKLVTLGSVLAMAASCTVPDKFFSDAGGGGDDGVDANSGVTLTITISGNSNGTIVSDPAGIDCGAECELTVPVGTTITLTATPDANTGFTGWSGGGCSGTDACEVTVDADTTIDAAFDLLQFTLDVTKVGNGVGTVTAVPTGIDCGTDCTHDYDHGTSVTLTATAGAADSFIGWTGGGCSGMGTCVVDVTADTTVTASFALNNTIVVTKDGTGMGTVVANMGALNCGADCMESYAPGTTVTLTATAIGDAVFDSWSGGTCSGTASTCLVTVNSAVLVTATFTQNQYPLDVLRNGTGTGVVASDPAGIDCGGAGDCAHDYDSGTVVTLTATPTTGKFGGWTGGGCTGSLTPTCVVTVAAATTVTATFTQITITDVTSSTANGPYGPSSGISIQVTFSDPVTVDTTGGTPSLRLNSRTTPVLWTSGSGTNVLTFAYTVTVGDSATDLDYFNTAALALNSGTIKGAAGGDATLTLFTPGTAGSLGFNRNILVDGVVPTITNVTSSTANGAYNAGDAISIQVVFSETVTVSGGPPTLALSNSGTATYTSGSGGTTLTFSYTVATGHNSSDLDYSATTSLALNGATIRDAVSNNATLTLPSPGATGSLGANKALVIDTDVPAVSSVSSTILAGFYNAADVISIQVVFSENVTVAGGTPTLTLETGASDAVVNYGATSPGNTLNFSYTVATGHNSSDLDYVSTSALALGTATIRDAAGNDATLTLPAPGATNSLGANEAIVVDTTAPAVSSVSSSTAAGTYNLGDAISIQVQFSESVAVSGGTPTLTLETGSSDATVNYTSGSPGTTLTFGYTVGSGHVSADLDYVGTSSLSAGVATITDPAGNAATLTLATPGAAGSLGANEALVVDGAVPTVTSVSSTILAGAYNAGDTISIQVVFSENVTVTGTPTLTLETGASDAVVNYVSTSPSSTLNFTYTVATGHNSADLDYVSTSALAVAAGVTIRDAAGNDATLTLASPGAAGSLGANEALIVDTIAPTVTNVTSTTTNGTYGIGQTVNIQVQFSEVLAVSTVTGIPTLSVATASPAPTASFSTGNGAANQNFNYTVAAGHASPDLDYTSTTALVLNGATMRDPAGNDAVLTLPAPNATGSLRVNKALVIRNSALFTASGTFTVPSGVSSLRVLVVGGGGGGANGHQGGGGGGYIGSTTMTVSGGQGFNVTVGSGGSGATRQEANTITGNSAGGGSAFGSLGGASLSAAGGATVTTVNGPGANGGAGGGGSCNGGSPGGAGGTNGGDGGSCTFLGGTGFGDYTDTLAVFYARSITAGAGGGGGTSSHSGGGGGGGVLVNGAGSNGASGEQPFSGKGGAGYGGGGGAGGYDSPTSGTTRWAGGTGGSGVVYIEY